ncbi:unnamed protein product, partial [Sphacelaria rigidula]
MNNVPHDRRRSRQHGSLRDTTRAGGSGERAGAPKGQRRANRHEERSQESIDHNAGDTMRGQDHAWSESSSETIRWREITKQPFDLLLLVDTGEELQSARTLLSMPEYGAEDQEIVNGEGRKPA